MVRDPFSKEAATDLQDVLDALDDPDSRTIIKRLEKPMTAREISDVCDLPLSTTYRKLDRLNEASLLDEKAEIRTDGHHTMRYERAFESVMIALGDGDFEVNITRPSSSPEEQLARLWSEVSKET